MSSFGQIEEGVHYIRKFLIYSMKKVFLEREVVELVSNFDEKSYCECLKSESIIIIVIKKIFGPQT